MANEQNLIPLDKRAKSAQREIQSKGGKAKAAKDREKKTIQKILNDYLDGGIEKVESFKKLADATGIKSDSSIKELVTAVCILNTLEKGDVTELQKLVNLLGEENENTGVIDKLDAVLNGIDEVMSDE